MNEILDIIYNVSINHKLISELHIHKIFDILKNTYTLNDINYNIRYKKDILFTNNTMGSYYNNIIDIYLKRLYLFLKKYCYQTNFIYEYKLNENELYLRKNLFILKIIFHELEHYYQDKIFRQKLNNSLTNKLILLEENTLKEYENSKENKNKKNDYYNISFIERIADNNAYSNLLEVINPIKYEVSTLYNLIEIILLDIKFDGYIDNDSPTNRYFKFMNKEKEYLNILNKYNINNLSFDDRFKLGLPLEDYEYQTIKVYIKSKKRN